jgi:hypothetical protein
LNAIEKMHQALIGDALPAQKHIPDVLQEDKENEQRLIAFQAEARQHLNTLNKSRDSGLIKFLKMIATIVSLGTLYYPGRIWDVRGGKMMGNIGRFLPEEKEAESDLQKRQDEAQKKSQN